MWKLQIERYGFDEVVDYLAKAPVTIPLERFWMSDGYWTPMLN